MVNKLVKAGILTAAMALSGCGGYKFGVIPIGTLYDSHPETEISWGVQEPKDKIISYKYHDEPSMLYQVKDELHFTLRKDIGETYQDILNNFNVSVGNKDLRLKSITYFKNEWTVVYAFPDELEQFTELDAFFGKKENEQVTGEAVTLFLEDLVNNKF
jgi:hypothetical protein